MSKIVTLYLHCECCWASGGFSSAGPSWVRLQLTPGDPARASSFQAVGNSSQSPGDLAWALFHQEGGNSSQCPGEPAWALSPQVVGNSSQCNCSWRANPESTDVCQRFR